MFLLTKEFRFEAAHSLPQLPRSHKCHRVHGHSYRVEVVVETKRLDPKTGFAAGLDYADLDVFGDYLDARFDHRNLNEILGVENTTAERLAKYFFDWCHDRWPEVVAVRVHETPRTMVEYRG